MEKDWIEGQEAFNELVKHFMGDNYYIEDPLRNGQANVIILKEIKKAYPKNSIRIIGHI